LKADRVQNGFISRDDCGDCKRGIEWALMSREQSLG